MSGYRKLVTQLEKHSQGVSFCKKIGRFREYYYFALEVNQKNFLRYVSDNIDTIKSEISTFRKDSINLINNHKDEHQ